VKRWTWRERTGAAALVLAGEAVAGAWLLFTGTLAVVVAWWLVRLRRHPSGPCLWCKGRRGRNPGSDDEQWGYCEHCGRTGERLRFGAHWVRRDLRKRHWVRPSMRKRERK
jgi:hypothetical protein